MTVTASVTDGVIHASVEIAASPDVVFRALSSDEITRWWGSPETYQVTRWIGDVRPGGTWQADTLSADGARSMIVRGTFLVVDPPRVLEHTWEPSWENYMSTTVRYTLEPTATGTRVTVRHSGFHEAAVAAVGHAEGWKQVLGWLASRFDQ